MHEFDEQQCAYCESPQMAINLDRCLICETFQGACGDCIEKHRATHGPADIEAFRREMMDEPELTIRERVNLEMKEQIRRQAESLCDLVDRYEARLKQQENQCRALAEELDRRTPAS